MKIELTQNPTYQSVRAAVQRLDRDEMDLQDFGITAGSCFDQDEARFIIDVENALSAGQRIALAGRSETWVAGDPKEIALVRRHSGPGEVTRMREITPASIESDYTLEGEPISLWQMDPIPALAVILTDLELASEQMASAGDPFVIVRGGLVANTPALPCFDLDELDSDLPWAKHAADVWELWENMRELDLPGMKTWIEDVEEYIRDNGTDEDLERLDAEDQAWSLLR